MEIEDSFNFNSLQKAETTGDSPNTKHINNNNVDY
jgi:hypothetical protein